MNQDLFVKKSSLQIGGSEYKQAEYKGKILYLRFLAR